MNQAAIRPDAEFVLYWMTAARRSHWNYGLDRAIEWAQTLNRPLIVLEALRVDYPWASERFHRFVIDGMADNQRALEGSGALYHPYIEPTVGAGRGLLTALAENACVIVTDDYPAFFLPRMIASAGNRLGAMSPAVALEAVDSNGILPMRAADKVFARAYDFRRFLQRELPRFLSHAPRSKPLPDALPPIGALPDGVGERWPRASDEILAGAPGALRDLPIDHSVGPVSFDGGAREGRRLLARFLDERLADYGSRNEPEADSASGLSPYLHFGHVSAHEVLHAVATREAWSPHRVSDSTSGKRTGWWNMSAAAEGFLDQLVTWRELGHNFCTHRDDPAEFASLPEWAQRTLIDHSEDPREHVYSLEQFERAETHDELWNAAQNQLRQDGRIHNYLRMLWGKKILHWSATPQEALRIMLALNDKYAVDGRDPNSYSGIMWVLGRYDRPWGPERAVFGKIRYMTSASTRRKMRVGAYIDRWNGGQADLNL